MTFTRPLSGDDGREFLSHFEELPDGSWRVTKRFAFSGYPFLDTDAIPEGRILDEDSDVSGFLSSLYLSGLKRSLAAA